jgi:hypothetical protein
MSSEVEPCVVWALRVLLPFLAKLIEDYGSRRVLKALNWSGSVFVLVEEVFVLVRLLVIGF